MACDFKREIQIAMCDILHWSYRNLDKFPEELREHGKKIEDLYLKGNLISSIPIWISELDNLTELHLFDNNLHKIPEDITRLKSLRLLDIGRNKISCIPEQFTSMSSLCSFLAEENMISILPTSIGKMKSLAMLYLSHNTLITIPETIGECVSLRELVLDHNNLKALPRSLMFLPNLSYISFKENYFLYLPTIDPVSSPIVISGKNNFLTCITDDMLVRIFPRYCGGETAYNFEITRFDCWNEKFENHSIVLSETGNVLLIQFKEVYHKNKNTVPSLYELCLRNVANILQLTPNNVREKMNFYREIVELPNTIEIDLRYPTAVCRNCNCFLFKYAWIKVYSIDQPLVDNLNCKTEVIQIFCSSKCVNFWPPIEIYQFDLFLGFDIYLREIEWKQMKY